MTSTYTGLVGRVVGVVWGSLWIAIGLAAVTIIADAFAVLPGGVEQVLTNTVPVILTIAPTDSGSPIVALFFGLFAAVGLLYGLYEVFRALTESEYRITLNSSSGV